MPHLLATGPADGPTLLLAHSAGAAMDSAWMDDMAARLGSRGVRVLRFEFAYMAARRDGRRPPVPRADRVLDEYRAAWEEAGRPPFIGGKSYGGRVASMVADSLAADGLRGLVCLGYPFHPPGRPEQPRTAHLEHLATPALICQGERDPMGTTADVAGYLLAPTITVSWSPDGDHDLRPRKAVSGRTFADNLDAAATTVAAFLRAPAPRSM
jgi:predicted alpha/beta-hydrolase family hydrolase